MSQCSADNSIKVIQLWLTMSRLQESAFGLTAQELKEIKYVEKHSKIIIIQFL